MKKIILIAAAVLALGSCTREITDGGSLTGSTNTSTDNENVFPGWVRLKLTPDAAPLNVGVFTRGYSESGNSQLDEIAAKLGATEIRKVYSDGGKFAERRRRHGLHLWYDLKIDESISVTRAQSEVESIPGVDVAQPIYKIKLYDADAKYISADMIYSPAADAIRPTVPMPFNDEKLKLQWHYYNDGTGFNNPEGTRRKAGADINLFEGWKITTGSPDVTVAIIDKGVDFAHPDLAANMWINTGEIPGNNLDDDNNGYVDDIYGWNYADNLDNPQGSGSIVPGDHATHIAGTISAVNDNGIGVCGVAGGTGNNDGTKIMTLEFFSGNKQVMPSGDMFAYAADNGASIVSCSWGLNEALSQELLDGMTYFHEYAGCSKESTPDNKIQTGLVKGGTLVFAAGNSSSFSSDSPGNLDMCISVAAMGANYEMASYSNYSPDVDIMAPGGENMDVGVNIDVESKTLGVLSTFPGNQYGYMAGTSMATPHVVGVAALIVAKFGRQGYTNEMLRERLLSSFRPAKVDKAYANYIGAGMLDASMIELNNPHTTPESIPDARAEGSPDMMTILCTVTADGNNMPIAGYNLEYRKANTNDEWKKIKLVNQNGIGETYQYSMPLEQLVTFSFKMTPYDRFGSVGATSTFEGTPEEHINRPPEVKAKKPDLVIESVNADYPVRTSTFSNYFRDRDVAAYGDKLTYSISFSNDHIVKCELYEEGGEAKFRLTPVCKGTSVATMKATDIKGSSVETTFNYTVNKGDCGNHGGGEVIPPVDETSAAISVYPNPVVSTMNVKVSGQTQPAVADILIIDAAGRQIMKSTVQLDATGVGSKDLSSFVPGVYTVRMDVNGVRHTKNIVKK